MLWVFELMLDSVCCVLKFISLCMCVLMWVGLILVSMVCSLLVGLGWVWVEVVSRVRVRV